MAAAGINSGGGSSTAIGSRNGANDEKGGGDDDDEDERRNLSERTPETAEPKGPFLTSYSPSDKK